MLHAVSSIAINFLDSIYDVLIVLTAVYSLLSFCIYFLKLCSRLVSLSTFISIYDVDANTSNGSHTHLH